MSFTKSVFKNDEKAIFSLRDLYKKNGYSLYKVNKFEEYDLYARNKNFLVSSNILSFTDTDGKLLALKPDITLSIVKNVSDADNFTHKYCYNETVYRTSADSDGFREIMQTGLECIGKVDLFLECEVVSLALRSLYTISSDYLLDISHMGFVDGLLSEAHVDDGVRGEFIEIIKSKNIHALDNLCEKYGISNDMADRLRTITQLYLPIAKALPILKSIVVGEKMKAAYDKLVCVSAAMEAEGSPDKVFVDFSVVNDFNYYDGVCFKGFINGIPDSVLSGGRYDKLLQKLGKRLEAIGFAVYLDRLERYNNEFEKYDVDVVLTYSENIDIAKVIETRNSFIEEGKSVLADICPDPSLRYRQLIKLTEGGIEILETND